MSTKTDNYGLIKPEKTDTVNIGDLNSNFDTIDKELKNRPLTVNGVAPDSDGNVQIDTGVGAVRTINGEAPDADGNIEITVTVSEPATSKLNFDNWDAEEGAYYRETLDDGSSITHAIVRDADGKITSIGGIAIEGVG